MTCVLCGRPKRQARADKAATCGRSCGARLANDTKAERRASRLKIDALTARQAFVKGYKAGYQRGWAKRNVA